MKKLVCMLFCSLSCAARQTPLRFLKFPMNHINAQNTTGQIQVTIDGGVAPYTYIVGNQAFPNENTKQILVRGLSEGIQLIKVTDRMNNTIKTNIEILTSTGTSSTPGLSDNRALPAPRY